MQLILRLAIVLASLGGILGGSGAVSPLPFLRSASPVSLDLAPGSSGDFITSFSKQHRTASVDPAAICSGPAELDLNFFNGTPLAAIRTRFEDRGLEGCSWFGEVAGEPPHSSAVVLSLVAGRLAGIVQTRTRGYQILPVTDNTHLVADADMARLSARISALRTDAIPSPNWNVSTYKPEGAAPEDPAFASHILPPGEKRLSRRSMTVDIMVVYTAAALAVFGSAANARAIAQLNVDQTNEAFTRSAVSAQLRLVAVLPIDYEETGDVFVDLDRLKNPSDGYMDNVHALRNTYAADLVGFFIGGKMTFGGLGYLESRKDSAFHLVHSAAAGPIPGYYAMVHEIGHNFGGCHARNTYPNGKPAAGECGGYAFGYQQCQGPESDWWHTIMGGDCGTQGSPTVLQFSNPNVYYLGYPTGVSETDLDNAANVARKINERALAVSLFKPDPTPSQQTSLDLVGCESSFRGKPCTFAARLIIPLRNAAPVVGATVRFSIHFWTSNVHVEILKAVTDARGRAVGSWTPTSTTAKWGYTSLEATFDGDYDALGVLGASYDWHVAQVFTPVKATFVLPFTCRRGDVIRLEARLKESETGVPVKAGVEVSFKIGTPEIATVSATTDASGAAVVRQYRVPSYVQGSRLTVAAWVINSDDYGNFQTLGNGTITVLPPKLAAKVYVPNVTARRGARTTIKATISSPSGAKLPGMTVIFRVGTLVVGRKVTDSRGVAAVVYTVPKLALLGIKSLSATTVATAKYNAGRGTGKLTVVKA